MVDLVTVLSQVQKMRTTLTETDIPIVYGAIENARSDLRACQLDFDDECPLDYLLYDLQGIVYRTCEQIDYSIKYVDAFIELAEQIIGDAKNND